MDAMKSKAQALTNLQKILVCLRKRGALRSKRDSFFPVGCIATEVQERILEAAAIGLVIQVGDSRR